MKHQNPTQVDVSVVVIGRNEGTRLQRCLQSVRQSHWGDTRHELIYVDSRSSDDSVASAKALGAQVIVLNDSSPCAAKARNLGWWAARGEYVLFLDGDTELHPAFVSRALYTLAEPKLCAAWGHRRESRPQQSLYTTVLDLDWVYPTGRSLYFGGDVLVRRLQAKPGEQPMPMSLRDYGTGAQILRALGLGKIRLLSNSQRKVVGLDGYGLEIVEQMPV